jgi:hypothetical protein
MVSAEAGDPGMTGIMLAVKVAAHKGHNVKV